MNTLPLLLAIAVLAQTEPPPAPTEPQAPAPAASSDGAVRAAEAAERAATAAERAATAASQAAAAAERIAASSATAAPADAAKKEEEKKDAPKPVAWVGSVGLGFISLTGNSNTLTLNSTLFAERKSPTWIWAVKGFATYGQSRLVGDTGSPDVLALAAGLQGRGDRRLTDLLSLFLLAGADTDHVKSVEYRGYGEGGLGLLWLDQKKGDLQKLLLRTDLAFRFAEESRFQFYPTPENIDDVRLFAPRVGVAFRYALTEDVLFFQDAEVMFNVVGDSRIVANSMTKLSARLVGSLALGTSFQVQYDSQPAAGKVPTDTALSVLLEVGF